MSPWKTTYWRQTWRDHYVKISSNFLSYIKRLLKEICTTTSLTRVMASGERTRKKVLLSYVRDQFLAAIASLDQSEASVAKGRLHRIWDNISLEQCSQYHLSATTCLKHCTADGLLTTRHFKREQHEGRYFIFRPVSSTGRPTEATAGGCPTPSHPRTLVKSSNSRVHVHRQLDMT